jgi:hypothetical protein
MDVKQRQTLAFLCTNQTWALGLRMQRPRLGFKFMCGYKQLSTSKG